jgi:hypothetical protein
VNPKAVEEIGLVSAQECLEQLFPGKSRPSLHWFKELKKSGTIPFIRLRRRIFYDPVAVRRALGRYTSSSAEGEK